MPKVAPPQSRPRARSTDTAPDLQHGSGAAAAATASSLPLFLQRIPGAVIQAKRVVNEPGDAFEQDADALSDSVARGGDVSRESRAATTDSSDTGRRRPMPHDSPTLAIQPPDGGESIDAGIRARIEPALGTDLSGVRVHGSPAARDTADALHARAFTHRNHIWLGSNERADDAKLLAHEATHVVHQSSDAVPTGAAEPAPAIQRQHAGPSSSTVATPPPATGSEAGTSDASSTPEAPDGGSGSQPAEETLAATDTRADAREQRESGADAGGAEGAGGGQATGAQGEAGRDGGEGVGGAEAAVMEDTGDHSPPAVPETGAGNLETGDLVLIDVELAEHQRWEGALGRVGAAGSVDRARFIAEAAGTGFISGAASGAAMGLGIGLVTRAVPALGPIIGGGMALHGLITRDWAETGATIARFGEGNDTYETLANSIASIAAVIDVVSQVLTVINGIVGVVQAAAAIIAGGAVVAAFFTFGATLGIAAVAADVVGVCEEISVAINLVTGTLDEINAAILQPCVALFRALHTYTTQADPREVEAQGQGISGAAAASGAALGAWLGGKAAEAGGHVRPAAEETPPRSQRSGHETPPPAAGDGPAVHFQDPVTPGAHADATPTSAGHGEPTTTAAPPTPESATAPLAPPTATPEPVSTTAATPSTPGSTTPPPEAAPQYGPVHDANFSDLNPVVADVSQSPFGDRLASQAMAPMQDVPRDPTRSKQAVHDAAYADIPNERPAGWDPARGLQDQHWTKVRDATVNAAPGTLPATVDAINASRSPLQTFKAGESSLGLTTQGVPDSALPGGNRGTRFFVAEPHEGPMGRPAVPAEPGIPALPAEPGAAGGPARPANYNSEHRFADRYLIPEMRQQIQDSRARAGLPPLDDVQLTVAAGEQARYKMEGTPSTDLAQNPVKPWSGEVVQRPREPMQMLLAPEVLMPDLAARGRTVSPPPRPQPTPSPEVVTPNPNQTSFDFSVPARTPSTPGGTPPPVAPPVTPAPAPALGPSTTPTTPTASSSPHTPASTVGPTTAPQPTTPAAPSISAPAGAARSALAGQQPGGPQTGPGPVSWGTRAHQVGELFLPQIFGGGGHAPTYAEQQAAHRARFTADNQPAEGVERVNPEYPDPPATTEQITAIQDEIMNLLAVRATAEQEAQNQSQRADQCSANEGPIQQSRQDTAAGISAVQAHEAAVARREAVNQEQQRRQQESQGLVAGYPSQATGLTALSVPLAAWEGFTSLASHLPGDAGDSMMRMNQEAQQLQDNFAQMAAQMSGVDSQGPEREGELQDDQSRLESTGEQADTSAQQLDTASAGAEGLQQANDAAFDEARAREQAAHDRADECEQAASDREQQADSLAEQLRAWAAAHAAARQAAIAATQQRLASEGRTVVSTSER